MRIFATVMIVAIAIVVSPVAHGQVPLGSPPAGLQGPGAKPSAPAAPAAGAGDRALLPTNLPDIPPPSDALRNLAGRGYADANYVSPAERAKRSSGHRAAYSSRVRVARRYGHYCYPFYVCGYCYYD
jgi:hypothetical protein